MVRTNVDICDTLSFTTYFLKVSDVDEEVQETEEWKPKIILKPEERDRCEKGNKP